MLIDAEKGRLPSADGVALGAFTFFRAGVELAFVGIRGMAVLASGERNLLFEVVLDVACGAGNLGVLSEERIFSFGMVEIEPWQHGFPAAGGMAGIARFFELAAVRVGMAGRAGVKLHVLVASRSSRGIGLVAFFAGNLSMQACQRIARFGVIKFLGGFPTLDVVALGAFVAELSLVRIGVTGRAGRRLAKKGFRLILVLDERFDGGQHVRRGVTLFARDRGVFTVKVVAGQSVVELLLRRFPVNQTEVFTVVLQVAANALLPIRILHLHAEVVAVFVGEGFGDFFVAIEAFESGSFGTEDVARIALRGSGQGRMCLGERTRRDLCREAPGEQR